MSADRIDQALTFWEDICALENHRMAMQAVCETRVFKPEGPLKHLDFRDRLKRPDDWSNAYVYEGQRPSLVAMRGLPRIIHAWAASSKRVFCLSEEAAKSLFQQAQQSVTGTWDSFPWPFDAFAVSFGAPIVIGDLPGLFDTLMVSRVVIGGELMVRLQWLPTRLAAYRPFTDDELLSMLDDFEQVVIAGRNKLVAGLTRKRRRQLQREKLHGGDSSITRQVYLLAQLALAEGDRLVEQLSPDYQLMRRGYAVLLVKLTDQIDDHKNQQVRLLHAFCDYLARGVSTIGGSSGHVHNVAEHEDSIALGAKIFEVGSCSAFQTGDRVRDDPLSSSGRKMPPHSRRGYYRRVRGSAPDAPKIEWVDSTWIHREEARVRGMIPVSETVVDEAVRPQVQTSLEPDPSSSSERS